MPGVVPDCRFSHPLWSRHVCPKPALSPDFRRPEPDLSDSLYCAALPEFPITVTPATQSENIDSVKTNLLESSGRQRLEGFGRLELVQDELAPV
jgi:hypothetical protein